MEMSNDLTRAPQVPAKLPSEEETGAVSMAGKLSPGESLQGTPTVLELDTADLTISNESINTVETEINGQPVAAGQAVLFKVDGGKANWRYSLKVGGPTDASPTRVVFVIVEFTVSPE